MRRCMNETAYCIIARNTTFPKPASTVGVSRAHVTRSLNRTTGAPRDYFTHDYTHTQRLSRLPRLKLALHGGALAMGLVLDVEFHKTCRTLIFEMAFDDHN